MTGPETGAIVAYTRRRRSYPAAFDGMGRPTQNARARHLSILRGRDGRVYVVALLEREAVLGMSGRPRLDWSPAPGRAPEGLEPGQGRAGVRRSRRSGAVDGPAGRAAYRVA